MSSRELLTPLSRREFNKLFVWALVGFIANISDRDIETVAWYQEVLTTKTPEPHIKINWQETIDINYIKEIVKNLQEDRGTAEERSEAILESLTAIITQKGRATAFMINESGYYLTAGHVLGARPRPHVLYPETNPTFVHHILSGMVTPVKNFIIDNKHDIAIVFAPNGNTRKPVPNLQISLAIPGENTELNLLALSPGQKRTDWNIALLKGRSITSELKQNPEDWEEEIPVLGMIPFGGSSGGPVFDQQGIIIGIESGTLKKDPFSKASSRADYKGATVASLKAITSLLEKATRGEVYVLPMPLPAQFGAYR